jgi:hypothetical protein
MNATMKSKFRKAALGVAMAALTGSSVAANAVWDGTLPTTGNPLTSQQYQDFTIYSMPYLTNLSESNSTVGNPYYGWAPSPTYSVDSSPGQLHDQIVIVTGNTGQAISNLDTCGGTAAGSGCDNAYPYPSPAAQYFNSMATAEPSVVVSGEPSRSTWTATASSLRNYLGSQDLIFMFNLNEDNGGDENTLAGQSLLVSMRVQLTDANGLVIYTYYVGANNAIGLPTTAAQAWGANGAPIANPADPAYNPQLVDAGGSNGWYSTDPRWAYVHGRISVDATTGAFLGMGSCTYTGFANCKTINQNLGANEVAFSAFSQSLSDLIKDPLSGIAFMNVDFLTSGQSNGFEQLFITRANIPDQQVPEPNLMTLLSLALVACGIATRRWRNTSA